MTTKPKLSKQERRRLQELQRNSHILTSPHLKVDDVDLYMKDVFKMVMEEYIVLKKWDRLKSKYHTLNTPYTHLNSQVSNYELVWNILEDCVGHFSLDEILKGSKDYLNVIDYVEFSTSLKKKLSDVL